MKTRVSAGVKQETKLGPQCNGVGIDNGIVSFGVSKCFQRHLALGQILKTSGLENGKVLEQLKKFFAKQQCTAMKQLGAAVLFD